MGKLLQRFSILTRLLLLVLTPLCAQATVILEHSFEELVEKSQLIFQGRVLRTELVEVDGLVHTLVWFDIEETIKGEARAQELSLRFLGGTTVNASVDVAGQYLPKVGDHAVYFVSDPDDYQVNPLTGWHQGAFLIETLQDGELALDLSERPDLILFNTRGDPLVRKMLDLDFSEAQINAKFPEYARFPLADFKAAIRSLAGE